MRRPRAVRLVAGTCLCIVLPACTARERVNARCEWTGDSGGALDLSRSGNWQHLVTDVQLAEDLAIRNDDAAEARGTGRNEGVRCMGRLVAAIRARHGVTDADVQRALRYRNPAFDRAVLGSFVVLFAMGVWLACGIMHRRYLADSLTVRVAATALTALAAGLLAIPFSSLWIVTWELVRVGNDHLGAARGARMPGAPLEAIVIAGLLVFFITALLSERTARRSDPRLS